MLGFAPLVTDRNKIQYERMLLAPKKIEVHELQKTMFQAQRVKVYSLLKMVILYPVLDQKSIGSSSSLASVSQSFMASFFD